jgi:hypothetical protein
MRTKKIFSKENSRSKSKKSPIFNSYLRRISTKKKAFSMETLDYQKTNIQIGLKTKLFIIINFRENKTIT